VLGVPFPLLILWYVLFACPELLVRGIVVRAMC
jgi:hypothetical protein